jgi:hypothetical protein
MKTKTNIISPALTAIVLACFALSPVARAGRPQPTPTPTPTPPPSSFPNGMKEFTASTTFVVPAGVYKLDAQVWGAGGGGGQGDGVDGYTAVYGGDGSAGAYSRGIIPVTPGQSITITIGHGGYAGSPDNGGDGGDGEPSAVIAGNFSIISGGGHGGQFGVAQDHNGQPGALATPDPDASIGRAGKIGLSATHAIADMGYSGVPPAPGTVEPLGGYGGFGGYSANDPGYPSPGTTGYVFITW